MDNHPSMHLARCQTVNIPLNLSLKSILSQYTDFQALAWSPTSGLNPELQALAWSPTSDLAGDLLLRRLAMGDTKYQPLLRMV